MRVAVFSFLAALAWTGCVTTLERADPIDVSVGGTRLATTALVEALLDRRGTCVEAVAGTWGDRTFQANCVMKGDGETMRLVFLAPQMRLATIVLTRPHAISFDRIPDIPRTFEPEYALVDYAFVHLDAETLRQVLGTELTVSDDGTTRRIQMKGGPCIAEIVRSGTGIVVFRNLVHGYSYELKDLKDGS